MNWLYLITKNSESLDCVDKLLKNKNAVCSTLYVDDLSENFISDELISALHDAQYVILNIEKKFETNVNVIFALGYIEGKKMISFINSKVEFDTSLVAYSNVDELKKILKKNLSEYVAIDEKNKALSILFEKGIPFTPDFFGFEISKNNIDTCEIFVKAGMDIAVRDSSGTPMICIAARNKREDMVKWLLAKGADIDAVSQDRGYSAVMDAVWRSDEKMVEYLIKQKANLNFIANDGQTALIIATGSGRQKICEMLVKNGADPNFKDHMGMSAIDYANLFKKESLINLYKEYSK
ncbi:MAG: ankyrin repeat domain-containing protein [Treponemataceae bacterium]